MRFSRCLHRKSNLTIATRVLLPVSASVCQSVFFPETADVSCTHLRSTEPMAPMSSVKRQISQP